MTAGDDDGAEGTWVARVWADRDYHELVLARTHAAGDPDLATFPSLTPPHEVPLRGEEMRIGRRGDDPVPEIDLSGPPRDPGVSHLHAVLIAVTPDRWVVLDPGSTNGTSVNYAEDPLPVHTPVALRTGDRIHVGAWTTITVERR